MGLLKTVIASKATGASTGTVLVGSALGVDTKTMVAGSALRNQRKRNKEEDKRQEQMQKQVQQQAQSSAVQPPPPAGFPQQGARFCPQCGTPRNTPTAPHCGGCGGRF